MTRRRSRSPWRLLRLAVLVACLAVVFTAASHAGTALVVAVSVDDPQAIITLGSHEWERLPAAAQLAKAHPNALVFLTVPKQPTKHNCHDCEGRAARLVAAGVSPARLVMLPSRVSNTRDEAIAARTECTQRGFRRLVVVTSPYHTRRALATFVDVFTGTDATIGIVPSDRSPARPHQWWGSPYDRAYVGYEWAAIVYHAFKGR